MKNKFLISLFLSFVSASAYAFPAKFSASPDSSQALLLETVNSARSSILLNVYMITNTRLQNALLDRLAHGVQIQMLVEAEPSMDKKISDYEKRVLDTLSAAFKGSGKGLSHLFIMTSQNGTKNRRYVFDHAKYVVVDGKRAYVSSENFVTSGAMSDPNRKANRGWQVLLDDATTARTLTQIFKTDADLNQSDVVEYDPSLVSVITLPPRSPGSPSFDNRRSVAPIPGGTGDVQKVSVCLSPNSVPCLTDFIRSAKASLDLEHLSLPLQWIGHPASNSTNAGITSSIVVEAIAAAERGVKVRILLNDDGAGSAGLLPRLQSPGGNPYPKMTSRQIVDTLKSLAAQKGLELDAAVINSADLQLSLLHNKGMLADGLRAWVSSINGTENSVYNNREIGVDLESADAARYYGQLFELDWSKSAN